MNPDRLELAGRRSPTSCRSTSPSEDLREVMEQLGMKEGFDVGLEMSGAPAALDQMIDTW